MIPDYGCRWPHELLTTETERAIAAQIARYRPYLVRRAAWLAHGDPDLADELEQAGMLMLWELGLGAVEGARPAYVRKAIMRRMVKARQLEVGAMEAFI